MQPEYIQQDFGVAFVLVVCLGLLLVFGIPRLIAYQNNITPSDLIITDGYDCWLYYIGQCHMPILFLILVIALFSYAQCFTFHNSCYTSTYHTFLRHCDGTAKEFTDRVDFVLNGTIVNYMHPLGEDQFDRSLIESSIDTDKLVLARFDHFVAYHQTKYNELVLLNIAREPLWKLICLRIQTVLEIDEFTKKYVSPGLRHKCS